MDARPHRLTANIERLVRPWRLLGLAALAMALPCCGSDGILPDGTANAGGQAGSGNTVLGGGTTGGTSGSFASMDRLAVKNLSALPLSGCVYSDYYGSITVGDTEFQLLIDSGSSTTAIAANSCTACSALSPLYDLSQGTATSFSTDSTYGDQSGWVGTVHTDTLAATTNGTALTPAVDVSFVAITQETSFFTESICPGGNASSNGYQGILGLGPDSLLRDHTTSFMGALQSTAKLPNNAYAVQICDHGGRMWFGGYDPNFIAGEPQYTPMVQTGTVGQYYGVKVADMQFAGVSLGLSASALGSTVVDTGTSAFYLPTAIFEKYATALTANSNFKANFPASSSRSNIIYSGGCANSQLGLTPDQMDAALPTLGISFPNIDGKTKFTLTLKATESYLFTVKLSDGSFAYCSALSYASSLPILGNAMMREHIVIFDRDNEQVGFVPQAPCNMGYPLVTNQDP